MYPIIFRMLGGAKGGQYECTEVCGDGVNLGGQLECDDGNTDNGDGCDENCMVESGYEYDILTGICSKIIRPTIKVEQIGNTDKLVLSFSEKL